MSRYSPGGEAPRQLDLLGPPAEAWWEYDDGASRVFVVAAGREEAQEKVEALLHDLGVAPGGPPGLHESFLAMRDFATRAPLSDGAGAGPPRIARFACRSGAPAPAHGGVPLTRRKT